MVMPIVSPAMIANRYKFKPYDLQARMKKSLTNQSQLPGSQQPHQLTA